MAQFPSSYFYLTPLLIISFQLKEVTAVQGSVLANSLLLPTSIPREPPSNTFFTANISGPTTITGSFIQTPFNSPPGQLFSITNSSDGRQLTLTFPLSPNTFSPYPPNPYSPPQQSPQWYYSPSSYSPNVSPTNDNTSSYVYGIPPYPPAPSNLAYPVILNPGYVPPSHLPPDLQGTLQIPYVLGPPLFLQPHPSYSPYQPSSYYEVTPGPYGILPHRSTSQYSNDYYGEGVPTGRPVYGLISNETTFSYSSPTVTSTETKKTTKVYKKNKKEEEPIKAKSGLIPNETSTTTETTTEATGNFDTTKKGKNKKDKKQESTSSSTESSPRKSSKISSKERSTLETAQEESSTSSSLQANLTTSTIPLREVTNVTSPTDLTKTDRLETTNAVPPELTTTSKISTIKPNSTTTTSLTITITTPQTTLSTTSETLTASTTQTTTSSPPSTLPETTLTSTTTTTTTEAPPIKETTTKDNTSTSKIRQRQRRRPTTTQPPDDYEDPTNLEEDEEFEDEIPTTKRRRRKFHRRKSSIIITTSVELQNDGFNSPLSIVSEDESQTSKTYRGPRRHTTRMTTVVPQYDYDETITEATSYLPENFAKKLDIKGTVTNPSEPTTISSRRTFARKEVDSTSLPTLLISRPFSTQSTAKTPSVTVSPPSGSASDVQSSTDLSLINFLSEVQKSSSVHDFFTITPLPTERTLPPLSEAFFGPSTDKPSELNIPLNRRHRFVKPEQWGLPNNLKTAPRLIVL